MTDYYKVKDEVAFKDIKGKKVIIVESSRTPTVVSVRMIDGNDNSGYRFRTCELEPWVEPQPKPEKVKTNTIIAIGYLGAKRCYLNVSKEDAIRRYTDAEGEEPTENMIDTSVVEDEWYSYDVPTSSI